LALRNIPSVKYRPEIDHRRSIRLSNYDYSQTGAYFVTICTHKNECILENRALSAIAERAWREIVTAVGGGDDCDFVIMPNHLHGIVWINREPSVGARHRVINSEREKHAIAGCGTEPDDVPDASPLRPASRRPTAPPHGSLGAIIGSFKSVTAKRINRVRGTPGAPVWQRNYYEHIVRSEAELKRIREYIRDNPRRWRENPENPVNAGSRPFRLRLVGFDSASQIL
jgi:REP element-mobilizing transposase RayT